MSGRSLECEISRLTRTVRGRLGAAFYDRAKCTMYLVEDTIESAHYDLSHMRKSFNRAVFSPI